MRSKIGAALLGLVLLAGCSGGSPVDVGALVPDAASALKKVGGQVGLTKAEAAALCALDKKYFHPAAKVGLAVSPAPAAAAIGDEALYSAVQAICDELAKEEALPDGSK